MIVLTTCSRNGWRAALGLLVALLMTMTMLAATDSIAQEQGTYNNAPQATYNPNQNQNSYADPTNGVVRLRQSDVNSTTGNAANGSRQDDGRQDAGRVGSQQNRRADQERPYRPGEFELFVNRLAGNDFVRQSDGAVLFDDTAIRRFGAELVTARSGDATDYAPQVPPDYLLTPGDELVLTMWGSVDADLRLVIDRAGRLNIPRVGAVPVSGVRYGDLPALITQRVGQVFRNFHLSVSLGQLRGIRVYVTGFTARPGSYTVSSLSTIINALMRAGGPSAAGTFRSIELRRNGKLLTTFDLYDLLIKGDRASDRVLQAEDVIQIGAVGTQAAVIGSVNKPAIFELKPGETVGDMLRMAGGFTAVADRSRLAVEKLDERTGSRVAQLTLPQNLGVEPANGDVLRAFSAVEAVLPLDRQNKRVRVEGEVARPGDYILPPNSSIVDAIKAAGGLAPSAYVFGTEFSRESVRITQQENYDRALRDLQTELARSGTQKAESADEAQTQAARSAAGTRLIAQLSAIRPTGRIVLQLQPDARDLPELALENGDRIYVPALPTAIGVFGSVFNSGSYLYSTGRNVTDYLRLAGGTTRGADNGSAFVIRANGSVVSARQSGSLFSGNLNDVPALPGDTLYVPEELDKTTFAQAVREWTQILYQFGIGAAALQVLR